MITMYIFKNRQSLRKRSNKAQTSIFVAVGLIMFIVVIIGFFIVKNIKTSKIVEEPKKTSDLSFQAEEVRKFINDCIRKSTWDGLITLGKTGGYIVIPNLIDLQVTILWYLDQANIQPYLNETQQRLIDYINTTVPKCIDAGNISKFGFIIEKAQPTTFVEFGNNDVTVKILYPIKLTKEKFYKEYKEFFNSFDLRYRAVFEAATEVNERIFDEDFEIEDPLKKMDYIKQLDFDIAYSSPASNFIKFTLTDKKSITTTNQFYTFSFVAKLGNSSLIKITDLQNNSAINPSLLPFIIYSVDKKAQLLINRGTTVNLNGQSVKQINVQQHYPNYVITSNVPVYKKNSDILQRQDIKYIIDNPIYNFEPEGIRFNQYERLTIYYDDDVLDDKGVGILMGKHGFWVPIVAFHEPQYKRVFANILGFTNFTAIYCVTQPIKQTIAEHFFKPSPPCFVFLAIGIIAIALSAYLLFAAPGLLSSLASLNFGAVGESIAGAFGATGLATISPGLTIAIGVAYTALTAIALTGTILSATTEAFYEQSPDNCQTFYPSCAQTISVDKEEDDGTGFCFPDGSAQVIAGQPTTVCAQIKKCNMISKFLCMPCSVKCTASFV